MSIIDAVNAKLARAGAKADATDQKVSSEVSTARDAEASLAARCLALEVDRDSQGAAIATLNATMAAQTARVDALVAQLTELGVTA